MAFSKFIESSLCMLVIAAGLCVAVSLRLLTEETGNTCLLFGEVDFLAKNVTGGSIQYCELGFYSSIVDALIASFLICLRWCCLVKNEKPSMIYGSLISFVLATLAWLNCLTRGAFMITGINGWCASIKNAGSSCEQAAVSWNWKEFNPQPLNGSNSYDHFLMIEISSYISIALWFLVAFVSGTQMRKTIYHFLDAQELYRQEQLQISRQMNTYQGQPVYQSNQQQDPKLYGIRDQMQDPRSFELYQTDQIEDPRLYNMYRKDQIHGSRALSIDDRDQMLDPRLFMGRDPYEEEFDPQINQGKMTHL